MPLEAIIPAIIGSIIGSAGQEMANASPQGSGVPDVAVPRVLPQQAMKGEMVLVGPMNAEIDGQRKMFSPGVQIRDPFNMVVFPGMLPQRPLPVRYLTDPAGNVFRVWILSAQEAARP